MRFQPSPSRLRQAERNGSAAVLPRPPLALHARSRGLFGHDLHDSYHKGCPTMCRTLCGRSAPLGRYPGETGAPDELEETVTGV
jgi:hypothetical protein